MKLLFVNYEFPPLGGGGGNANAQIARQMAAMGHDVKVVTSAFKGLPSHEERDGYTILRIPALRRFQEKCRVFEMISFMISSIFYVVWMAGPWRRRRWKPDVSIAFFTIPSGPAAWVLKKIYRIPYIVSLRGGDVPGFMKSQLWVHHKLTSRIIRYLWQGARAVVANSEGLKRLALKTADEIDIMTIPNGVDSEFFSPQTRRPEIQQELIFTEGAQKNQDENSQRILRIMTAGRLTPQKGIDTLLFSYWRMKPHLQRPVQIWIAGDGPRRASLEQLAHDLRIQDDVFFLGWRDKDTLKNLYASSDIFVLPSLDEGMPNVVLEAMAMGLPVVATAIAGSQELVEPGTNGFLVPPKNPDVMSQKLMQLITDDDLRAAMALASLQKAKEFDWKEVARDYIDLCDVSL